MIERQMDKPLVILHGQIKSPPFSVEARRWAGFLLRGLQRGRVLTMPDSRPMPSIGMRCHELRLRDSQSRVIWRLVYRLDSDAVVIADIFAKKTQKTPDEVIARCKNRFQQYDRDRRQV
jgi:phage-related protein